MQLEMPSRIYSPLGVGGNANHIQVREWAVKHWLYWEKKCDLFFYEDLPYAAKLESSLNETEQSILREVEPSCGKIYPCLEPLSKKMLERKLLLSRFYFSQTDHSSLLEKFAELRGKSTKTGFAEAMFNVT